MERVNLTLNTDTSEMDNVAQRCVAVCENDPARVAELQAIFDDSDLFVTETVSESPIIRLILRPSERLLAFLG